MRARVYIETSVVSYLVARPSRDLVVAARQRISLDWWALRKDEYDLYISQLVVAEASGGDADAAGLRLDLIAGLPVLDITPAAIDLARHVIDSGVLPSDAGADALHIAIAASHGVQFLLTWNCEHTANAKRRPGVEKACRERGVPPPVLCTPEELMGD